MINKFIWNSIKDTVSPIAERIFNKLEIFSEKHNLERFTTVATLFLGIAIIITLPISLLVCIEGIMGLIAYPFYFNDYPFYFTAMELLWPSIKLVMLSAWSFTLIHKATLWINKYGSFPALETMGILTKMI